MPARHVLVYTDSAGIYGAEQINHQIALALSRSGYRVSVAQPPSENRLVAERRDHAIGHYWLEREDPYHPSLAAKGFHDPGEARRAFSALAPDLVFFADGFPFANLAAKHAARELDLPYIVLVHCVHAPWARTYARFADRMRVAYGAARRLVAVSRQNLQCLADGFGVRNPAARVILNGRPDDFFEPRDAVKRREIRSRFGVAAGQVLCLTVGRLETVKGYPYLLEALGPRGGLQPGDRSCPLAFLWVGTGTLEKRIAMFARMLGKGSVHMVPEFSDVAALYDAADMLVHPAEFEGMPLVVIEAMAKGLPVLATDVGGNAEALGEAGVLLPPPLETPGFATRLSAALLALGSDSGLRERLGAAGRARAGRLFRGARMTGEYVTLVDEVLRQHR